MSSKVTVWDVILKILNILSFGIAHYLSKRKEKSKNEESEDSSK